MAFCGRCGQENLGEANYCSRCGRPLFTVDSGAVGERVKDFYGDTHPEQLIIRFEDRTRASNAQEGAKFVPLCEDGSDAVC